MGGMFGGGGGAQTTNDLKLPTWAAEPANEYLRDAYTLATQAYVKYNGWRYAYETSDAGITNQSHGGTDSVPGRTYAVMNNNEAYGIQMLVNRAAQGDPVISDAYTLVNTIMTGGRITLNGKLNALYDQEVRELLQEFNEVTVPTIDQSAIMGGYYGGSGHNALMYRAADELGNKVRMILKNIFYRDYAESVAEIPAVMSTVTALGQEGVRNMELLRQAGLYKREYMQGFYSDAYKAFLDAEDINIKKLNILGNAVKTLAGSSSSETMPLYRPSPFTSMAGFAVAGTAAAMAMYKGTSRKEISDFSRENIPAAGSDYIENFGISNVDSPMPAINNLVEQRSQ